MPKLQQDADWPFENFDQTQFQVKYVGSDTLGRTSLGEVSPSGLVLSGLKSLELVSYGYWVLTGVCGWGESERMRVKSNIVTT